DSRAEACQFLPGHESVGAFTHRQNERAGPRDALFVDRGGGWSQRCLARSALAPGMDREHQDGQQSRLVVLEHQLAVVEVGDGLREGEPESCALIGAAGVEPSEAAACFVAPLGRNSWAAVADLDPNVALVRLDPDSDLASGSAVA